MPITVEEIRERFEARQHRLSADSLAEKFGISIDWGDAGKKRTLPYKCKSTLRKVRDSGRWAATKPTIIAATQKLLSYVICTGHTYRFSPRRLPVKNKRLLKTQLAGADALTLRLELALEALFWYQIQEESFYRFIRDGEFFRRVWDTATGIDITFLEPEHIENPTDIQRITNIEEVPTPIIQAMQKLNQPVGMLGIVFDPQDVRIVLGYWHLLPKQGRDGGDVWEWIDGRKVQHCKDGVDRNDPRGIPRFYWALCHVAGIDEINGAMIDLALVQAEHAAIYNYDQSTMISDIELIARNKKIKQDENEGRPQSPGVTHAKGFRVEMPGISTSAKDNVEIIQQEQRFIGNVSDIPEFMITADANTGNRSSLVAAGDPFDRRVQRDQAKLFHADREVLWKIVGADEDNLRMTYELIPNYPIAHSRDHNKDVESELSLLEAGIKSKRQVRQSVGVDHVQAEFDLDQEPKEPEPNSSPGGPDNGGNMEQ
jgi:hypothetical protein